MSHPTTNASGGFFTKPYGFSSAGQSSSSPSSFLPPQSPSSSSGDHSMTIAAARRRKDNVDNDDDGGDNLYSGHRTFPDQANWKTDMQKQNREDEKVTPLDNIGPERYSGTVKWYDPRRIMGSSPVTVTEKTSLFTALPSKDATRIFSLGRKWSTPWLPPPTVN